jgi:hypothetical protein
MVVKELIKLMITTTLMPLVLLLGVILIFIAIHESIWESREREVSP